MARLREQAQHLQPGDIVGTGEIVHSIVRDSIHWPSSKICIRFWSKTEPTKIGREAMWGKRTMINITRNLPNPFMGS